MKDLAEEEALRKHIERSWEDRFPAFEAVSLQVLRQAADHEKGERVIQMA